MLGLLTLWVTQISFAASPIPAESRQLVLVRAKDWDSIHGTLQRYERPSRKGAWRAIGKPIDVMVGRNGLAWGLGLHSVPRQDPGVYRPEARKREGDGKAPAGVFTFWKAFGQAPPATLEKARERRGLDAWPYVQVTPELHCVDSPASPDYNDFQVLPIGRQAPWKSSENMSAVGDAYRWGLFVNHNRAPLPRPPSALAAREPGAGSCIFLHVWRDERTPTAGCTSMAERPLLTLLGWIRADALPVLVQLPEQVIPSLQAEWGLPD